MLLFISTFCKINFSSINLDTELGQQATILIVGRNKETHAQSTLNLTKQCD